MLQELLEAGMITHAGKGVNRIVRHLQAAAPDDMLKAAELIGTPVGRHSSQRKHTCVHGAYGSCSTQCNIRQTLAWPAFLLSHC